MNRNGCSALSPVMAQRVSTAARGSCGAVIGAAGSAGLVGLTGVAAGIARKRGLRIAYDRRKAQGARDDDGGGKR